MADPDEADLVVQMMHKRFFGKRQLEAHIWDGKTKYKCAHILGELQFVLICFQHNLFLSFRVEETKVEEQKRLSNWDNFLITGEEDESKKASNIPESKGTTPESLEIAADKGENITDDVDDDDYFEDADKDDLLENKLDTVA